MRITDVVVLVSGLNLLLVSYSSGQGSLTPPGAPAPTMKSLAQIDAGVTQVDGHVTQVDGHITKIDSHITSAGEKRIPIGAAHTGGDNDNTFVIKQSGSYYLTGNIKVTGALNGISVQASDVTIDLNGFALVGPGQGASGGRAIAATGNDVRVRNGFIDGWPSDAIYVGAAAVLQDLEIQNCGGYGVHAGAQAQIRHSRVGAVQQGITVGDSSVVDSCVVIAGATTNIVTGGNCLIAHNVSNYATQSPGYGIYPGMYSVVRDNVCNRNKIGIFADGTGMRIEGNVAVQNSVYGIQVMEDTAVVIRNLAGYNFFNYVTPSGSPNVGAIQSPSNMTNPAANIQL
jgi:hypothetical protein